MMTDSQAGVRYYWHQKQTSKAIGRLHHAEIPNQAGFPRTVNSVPYPNNSADCSKRESRIFPTSGRSTWENAIRPSLS